jgi:glucose-6-phosphate 1-dehydrogenase
MVIFGASGDLTKRKLLPALANLAAEGLLPARFAIIGVARTPYAEEEFRSKMQAELKEFAEDTIEFDQLERLLHSLYYAAGEFGDPATYRNLGTRLAEIDQRHGTGGNYLFYLATPPSFFAEIVAELADARLTREESGHWRRIVVEKPFGHDLESARALNQHLLERVRESQIYRIDHYLGKETVQNIMAFRFGNGIFEPVWNRRYIDHIQIAVCETVGVEERGGYYEEAGALRDMVPNHLFQLLALVGMEPPVSFNADSVNDERVKVLQALRPLSPEDVLKNGVRGQYGPGVVDAERVPGYREEAKVAHGSTVETFVALKLVLDNWRLGDVPFYLRTGKRLPHRVTEVAIQFKCPPFLLFRDVSVSTLTSNMLVIRIQPNEGISLRFEAKVPGPDVKLGTVKMDFNYADYFGATPSTGYETLLYDVMTGDSTLFPRADMVEAGWKVVAPILDVWRALPPRRFPNYEAGTSGPKEADDLMARDGRTWRPL